MPWGELPPAIDSLGRRRQTIAERAHPMTIPRTPHYDQMMTRLQLATVITGCAVFVVFTVWVIGLSVGLLP
jgi:hypothetical protein